ncbi:MAG: hypothetical protein QM308_08995 [Bacillota bacterium]|nr:hypothetical protein [Bacillota bacterium]
MKRFLSVLLFISFLFCAASLADEITTEELQASAARQYPDWRIWRTTRYPSREWNGELTDHCKISLFRVSGDQLELKELHALLNPLKKGGEIPWEASDWARVPLTEDAAQRVSSLPSSNLPEFCPGFVFDESILPGSAAFLLEQDMKWQWLAAYPDNLVGVAADSKGLYSLRIARWNGSEYAETVFSPLQQAAFEVNGTHSFNDALELFADPVEFSLNRDSNGVWQLEIINNGDEVFRVGQHGIFDMTYGGNAQSNAERHYGKPLFPMVLEEMNFSEIPATIEKTLALLDAENYACTKTDKAGLYDAPEGNQLAVCFTRVAGPIKETQGDWVCLEIGDDVHGMTAWLHRDDLAFGKEIESVACGFPSYDEMENEKESLSKALPELSVPLKDYSNAVWLIGQAPDGRWLVEVNEQQVLFAEEDAFTGVMPPEPEE